MTPDEVKSRMIWKGKDKITEETLSIAFPDTEGREYTLHLALEDDGETIWRLDVSEKRLRSLEEYERERHEAYEASQKDIQLDVACPGCGRGIWTLRSGIVYATIPPRRPAWCTNCTWKGSVPA